MSRTAILLIPVSLGLFACKDDEAKGKKQQGTVTAYSLSVLSPEQDAQYEIGELVTLSVAVASDSGEELSLDEVSWTTGDWLANGNNLSVSDLPDGSRSLNVTAVAAGDSYTGSVDIHIGDYGTGDTGESGSTEDFEGVIEASIILKLEAGTTYDDPCEGWADFSTEEIQMLGAGSCRAFGEDWDFEISGTDKDGVLAGNLSMQFDDVEPEPTPFTGTRDELGHVTIDFSGTHYPGEVSGVAIEYLTISGTITADPATD